MSNAGVMMTRMNMTTLITELTMIKHDNDENKKCSKRKEKITLFPTVIGKFCINSC